MTLETPWITATGQRWKVYVLLLLLGLILLLMVASFAPAIRRNVFPYDDDALFVLSGVVGVALIAWMALAVSCLRCKNRIGLWYMSNRSPLMFFTAFMTASECPVCGYAGAQSKP
jgi:hypothetical protein